MKLLDGVSDLFRPIPNEHLPELQAYLLRSVRVVSAVSIALATGFVVVELALSELPRAMILTHAGYILGSFFGLFVLAGQPKAVRYAEPLVLAFAVALLVGLTISGTMQATILAPASYSPVIPMSAGAFLPWKPLYSIGLGVLAMAVPLALAPDAMEVSLPTYVAMGCTYTILAAVANQLQRRLWLQLESARAQLIAAERLANLGQMIAGMGHELKTPLATTSNRLTQIRSLAGELDESIGHPSVDDTDLREIAREITESVDGAEKGVTRAARFVATLRHQTAGLNEVTSERFKVRGRVDAALALLEHISKKHNLEILIEGPPDATLVGDPSRFEQVASNLIRNAMDACREGGSKVVISWEVRGEEGLYFRVDDDGPGVCDEIAPRLFEPLFTTKGDEGGTGIGLPLCRDIVEGTFGGSLRFVPSAVGARFEAHFPPEGYMVRSSAPWTPLGRVRG